MVTSVGQELFTINTIQINFRKCLFVATVATDSAVFVATLPVEYQSLTVNHFSVT